MTVRLTVLCPELAKYPAKGIGPDFAKDRVIELMAEDRSRKESDAIVRSEITAQTKINEKFNARGSELGDILISKLKDVDMTWCKDGCVVISCDNTIAEMEKVIADEGFEIKPDRSEIKHKGRTLPDGTSEEDIDEVFEPKTVGELKKLKSRLVTNQFKLKSRLIE